MLKRKRDELEEAKRDLGEKLRGWKARFQGEYGRAPVVADLDGNPHVKRMRTRFEDLRREIAATAVIPDLSGEEVADTQGEYDRKKASWKKWTALFAAEHGRAPGKADLALPQYAAAAKMYDTLRVLKQTVDFYRPKPVFDKPPPRGAAAQAARGDGHVERLTLTAEEMAAFVAGDGIAEAGEEEEVADVEEAPEAGGEEGHEEWPEEEECEVAAEEEEKELPADLKLSFAPGFKFAGGDQLAGDGAKKEGDAAAVAGSAKPDFTFDFTAGLASTALPTPAQPAVKFDFSGGGSFKFGASS